MPIETGKPCRKCGGTDRYKVEGRIGKCIKCHKRTSKPLESYYRTRESCMLNEEWRVNKILLMAKGRANKYHREFNLDFEYLWNIWEKQEGKCALSGRQFDLKYSERFRKGPHGPSLDRIDSDKGYIKGNVRFVTMQVNLALAEYGEDYFMQMINDVYNKVNM